MMYADDNYYVFIWRSKLVKTDHSLQPIWAIDNVSGVTEGVIKTSQGNYIAYGKLGNGIGILKVSEDGEILISKTEILEYGYFNGHPGKIPIAIDDNENIIISYYYDQTSNDGSFIVKFDPNLNEIDNSGFNSDNLFAIHYNRSPYNFYQFKGSRNYVNGHQTHFLIEHPNDEFIFGGRATKYIDQNTSDNSVGYLFKSKIFD